jgi:hypothetical protein
MSPESTGLFWSDVLARSEVDILMLQDGIGRHRFRFDTIEQRYDHVEQYFRSVGSACAAQARPREFWADVELFSQDRSNPALLWPGDIDTIAVQLGVAQRLTQKLIGYDFHRYMNPGANRWPASVYWEYDALLRGWTNRALHGPYSCLRSTAPGFPDQRLLTDGIKQDQDDALTGWNDSTPIDIEIPLPAPCSVASIKCYFRQGTDSLARLPDSVQFYSTRDDTMDYLGVARPLDGRPGLRKLLLNLHPAQVLEGTRVRVFPAGTNTVFTLLSEIEIVGKESAIGIAEPARAPQPALRTPQLTVCSPCRDRLELRFSAPALRNTAVTVYDAAGRKADEFRVSPGIASARLDISRLSAGVYFLKTDAAPGIRARFTKGM